MDVQRKKGILEVCVLAVLKKGPSYGYLIIRELERCVDISESTLYPILKRLEQGGSLETYRMEYNGRMRKYYRLTQGGQHKIDAFLDEWGELRKMYQFVAEQNARTQEPDMGESMPVDPEVSERKEAGAVAGSETGQQARAVEPESAETGQEASCPAEMDELPAGEYRKTGGIGA